MVLAYGPSINPLVRGPDADDDGVGGDAPRVA
jgi:hypothetical protein